jgi:S1-C subfamily serine protease
MLISSSTGSNAGIALAVPVNAVDRVVPVLIAGGRYADPLLGISGMSLNPMAAEALELRVSWGVMLRNVVSDRPAAKAGLRGSDRNIESERGTCV